jgi:hypothetical protein
MPEEVEEAVDSILADNPEMSEEEAYAIAWDQYDEGSEERAKLAKSASTGDVQRVGFEARVGGSVNALWKNDDDFVIWGPASVEVVDKENDRIEASALQDALPQLMKRQSLSYEHSDQIVGEILDKFETDEPVEVEYGDYAEKRQEFPTDVIEHDGLDAPALFVAGNVYDDTQKAQDVRDAIDKGDIDSYSISGEAIVSSMAIEDGEPVTDISKLDLSAVTLCESGMNQLAKFGVVKKNDAEPSESKTLSRNQAEAVIKSRTMGDTLTKQEMEKLLDKNLPDGEIPTKEDVEDISKKTAEQVFKENATNTEDETEGSTERPDGNDSNPVEQDNEYEGDADENPADDSDKVEEKSLNPEKVKSYLKSQLPDDQFKAVEPLLDEEAEDVETVEPGDEEDDEMDEMPSPDPEPEPDDEPDEELVEEKAKSLGLDPDNLSTTQKQAIAKADPSGVESVAGVQGVAKSEEDGIGWDADDDDIQKSIEKAEGSTMAGGKFIAGDGEVKL